MKISFVLHDSGRSDRHSLFTPADESSLEGLVVLSLAVVQHAELQEGGAVVVAQPRGRRQILDGFLRIPHPDVTFCAELPRLGIPGGDLKRDVQTDSTQLNSRGHYVFKTDI